MLDAYSAALVVGAPIIRNSCNKFCRNLLLGLDFGEDFKPFNPSLAMVNDHAFGIVRIDTIRPHLDQIYYSSNRRKGKIQPFLPIKRRLELS